MELTQQQIDDIDNILLTIDEDISFEEKHEEVMDTCLDNGIFNLEGNIQFRRRRRWGFV